MVDDLERDHRWPGLWAPLADVHVCAVMSAPIWLHGRAGGNLDVAPSALDAGRRPWLTAFAGVVTAVLRFALDADRRGRMVEVPASMAASDSLAAVGSATARIGGVMSSVDPSERPDEAVLRAVAGAVEEAFNAHDAQRAAEVFTEDAVVEDPGAPGAVLRGRSEIRAYFESWLRAFPDAQMRQEVLFTPLDGGEYASRWRIWGTMEQDLRPPGFAATHGHVENEGVAIIELRGNLVSRCRQFYDTTHVARQLGAAPQRGSGLERVGVLAQRLSVILKSRMRRT